MSNVSPGEIVRAMLQAAEDADTVADLPKAGTFAQQYADSVKDEINADNMDAFIHGTAVINLLVQEAILRVNTVAQDAEPSDENETAFITGVVEGAMSVAKIMGMNADTIVQSMLEGPAFQRAFNDIVANF